jgi:electron transport complex protein RnfG
MKSTVILSAALAAVCTLASAVLAVADHYTKDARAAAKLAEKSEALRQVLPPFDNEPLEDAVKLDAEQHAVTVFRARRDGQIVGFAGQGTTDQGFGGRIEILVGLKTDGTIRKIVVTSHAETPGLGTIATDRRAVRTLRDVFSGSTQDDRQESAVPPSAYLDQYERYRVTEEATYRVTKDGGEIEAVSGATISSRAIADAVSRVAQAFAENRDRLVE